MLPLNTCGFKVKPQEIIRLRFAAGWKQTDLATLCKVGISTVRNWERGKSTPYGYARQMLVQLFRRFICDYQKIQTREARLLVPSSRIKKLYSAKTDKQICQRDLVALAGHGFGPEALEILRDSARRRRRARDRGRAKSIQTKQARASARDRARWEAKQARWKAHQAEQKKEKAYARTGS